MVEAAPNTIVKKITTAANSRPAVDAATGKVYAASFATGEVAVIDPDSLTIVAHPDRCDAQQDRHRLQAPRRVHVDLFKKTFTVIDLKTNAVVAIPAGVGVHTPRRRRTHGDRVLHTVPELGT